MSKNSAKQRITQLKEWLATRSTGSNDSKKERKFSKADHYKNKLVAKSKLILEKIKKIKNHGKKNTSQG